MHEKASIMIDYFMSDRAWERDEYGISSCNASCVKQAGNSQYLRN